MIQLSIVLKSNNNDSQRTAVLEKSYDYIGQLDKLVEDYTKFVTNFYGLEEKKEDADSTGS